MAVVGTLAVPSIARGQGAPRVHVVRAGETLWRIATNELGDGHRWRELVRLNSRIRSERSLPVGMRLVLPRGRRGAGRAGAGTAAGESAARTAASGPATRAARAPGAPGAAAPTSPPSRAGEAAPTLVTADSLSTPTIFAAAARSRRLDGSREGGRGGALKGASSAEPVGTMTPAASRAQVAEGGAGVQSAASVGADAIARETLVAPWFDDADVVARGGRVLRRLDPPALERSIEHRTLHLFDRVQLVAPSGAPAVERAAFLVVEVGAPVADLGRLVTPVGIIHVTRSPDGASPAEGVVTAAFCALAEGGALVPMVSAGAAAEVGERSERLDPVEGRVVAVVGGAALPTLQHVVMLDVGAARGLRTGDAVTFLTDDRGAAGQEIARGVVLRVTARSASALIIRQSQPLLREGVRARVTRALP